MLDAQRIFRSLAFLLVGFLAAVSGHANLVFSDPHGTGQSQTYVPGFTADFTGTLQAYFLPDARVAFTNGIGIYVGNAPDSNSLNGVTISSLTNKTAKFGTALFGNGIHVNKGDTFYFVELADMTNVIKWWRPGCVLPGVSRTAQCIWSNESVNYYGGSVSFSSKLPAGYNTMAYTTDYNTHGQTLFGGGPGTGIAAGTIAAGDYTYVGFNDWLGAPSNSYHDFAFLFNITCSAGSTDCGNHVPEPGTLLLVAMGLIGLSLLDRSRQWRAGYSLTHQLHAL